MGGVLIGRRGDTDWRCGDTGCGRGEIGWGLVLLARRDMATAWVSKLGPSLGGFGGRDR